MNVTEVKPMNATPEIRTLLARLELVSHAPVQGYDFAPSEVGRGERNRVSNRRPPIPHLGAHRPKGGDTKVPRGSDVERRPRAPKHPPIEGDAASKNAWDAYEDELAAWKASYHRRTVGYFRRRIEQSVSDGGMRQIEREIEETIEAWQRTPLIAGMRPAMADPRWKQWVGECEHSVALLVSWYPCSRAQIYKIRKAYREGGLAA